MDAEIIQRWSDLSEILVVFGDVTSVFSELKDDNVFNKNSESINDESVNEALRLNSLATQAHKNAKFSNAILLFTEAIALLNVSAHDPCAALNKYEKAITSYECALAPDPINTQIQKTLFESQLVHGRQLRQEHLDPRFQPKTMPENSNEMREQFGADPTRLADPGLDVKKDHKAAFKLYEQAADQSSHSSLSSFLPNLGVAESEHTLRLKCAERAVVHKHLKLYLQVYLIL
ncbi:unnamed protein product [Adineta ricciae]|uniref:Uncharacterized protein n=1 Tax=Adineta ricciae TaxID=249248 RepID=A0A815LIT1_ADIRI|nr:unnamed protein product [Adineta ricciae]CAF1410630.1 unnamed protein product [Adineta ricciae]